MGGGKGGGGGSTQSQTTRVEPWSGVQPYITDYLSRASAVSNRPFQYNPGDVISPLAPEQQYGLSATTQRAIQGSPVNLAAQTNAYNTLQGQYMSPESNPWLKQTVDTALGDVQSRVNSQFNRGANFGGTAHQELLTRNLGQTAADIYGQNYQQERGRQLQTQALAPTLAETDYRDLQALTGVGDVRRGLSQDYLNLANQVYGNYLGYPQQQVDALGRAVQVGMGGGSTSTSTAPNPYQSNPIAGAIGGAATGYGLAPMLGVSGPWGALGGAVLGGLLG